MPPPNLEPIIVEPENHNDKTVDRDSGKFALYDSDWPVETRPKYKVPKDTPPLRHPHFPPGEVAAWAFGRGHEWMKERLKGPPYQRALMLDANTPLTFRVVPRGKFGERRFTLADIERLAWALYKRGDITGHELQCAFQVVLAVAEQYKRRLK